MSPFCRAIASLRSGDRPRLVPSPSPAGPSDTREHGRKGRSGQGRNPRLLASYAVRRAGRPRTDHPDVRGQPLGAPHNWPVAADSSLGRSVLLVHILGILIGARRAAEIGPSVGDHPIVTRRCGRSRGDSVTDLTRYFRGRPAPWILVGMLPDRVACGDDGNLTPPRSFTQNVLPAPAS